MIGLRALESLEHGSGFLVYRAERANFSAGRDGLGRSIRGGYVRKADSSDSGEREVRWIVRGPGQIDNALRGVC